MRVKDKIVYLDSGGGKGYFCRAPRPCDVDRGIRISIAGLQHVFVFKIPKYKHRGSIHSFYVHDAEQWDKDEQIIADNGIIATMATPGNTV